MKIKKGLVIRKLGSKYVVVATGVLSNSFNGMIKLNEVGSDIFNLLKEDTDVSTVVSELTKIYNVDKEILENDVNNFISSFRESGLLDE